MKKILFAVFLVLVFVLVVLFYHSKPKYKIDISERKFDRYIVSKKEKKHFSKNSEELDLFKKILNGKTTNKASFNDNPVGVEDYFLFELFEGDEIFYFNIYEKDGSYYLEVTYDGIYSLKKEEFNILKDLYKLDDIDNLYSKYNVKSENIKFLEEYDDNQMYKDNCVVDNAKGTNFELFQDFEERVHNNLDSYIRIARKLSEERLLVVDLFYDGHTKSYFLIEKDIPENKKLSVKEFKKMTLYKYDGLNYKILYNDENDTLSGNVFKLIRY